VEENEDDWIMVVADQASKPAAMRAYFRMVRDE
jgi:hypothetical protein